MNQKKAELARQVLDLAATVNEGLEYIRQRHGEGHNPMDTAGPAFHRLRDLWEHIKNRTLVDHFNYAQPSVISGHEVYTFVAPGTQGYANPEGEEVKSYDLRQRLERLRRENKPHAPLGQALRATARVVSEVIANAAPSDFATVYRELVSVLEPRGSEHDDLWLPFVQVVSFVYLSNTSWFLVPGTE